MKKKSLKEAFLMPEEEEMMSEGAKMTRQHFQLIADVLRRNDAKEWGNLIGDFADALSATNPQFNRKAFFKAAGQDESEEDHGWA